ncbi:MAG: porin family protein [Prevotella sp.]|nr:porin family protein [Prevotella sp.]
MKKTIKLGLWLAFSGSLLPAAALAGGLMTNTNYHIAFDRMFARGATTEIDAAFSNPAGLAWGHEGFQLSLNFQKPWQNRDIEFNSTKYEGVASAPIVPALFASYKKERLALSAMIGIVGSGGFVKYDDGVPMFNVLLTKTISDLTGGLASATGGAIPAITPDQYAIDSEMKGKQYIYGGQFNFTYKLIDCLSAAVGVRANYYDGYYRGHVIANHGTKGSLAKLLLDVDQKGWGFTPIVSLNYHQGPLTLSARYEFRTKLNPKNDTNVLETELNKAGIIQEPLTNLVLAGAIPAEQAVAIGNAIQEKMGGGFSAYTAPYEDGVRTRYDMPSLLSVAAGYEFTPKLRAALEYHFFDDKNAKMGGDRQKELTHGTHEILAGVEYDINNQFTVSCGGQRTDYGLSDGYQQNTSFACDSYSVGLGGAWNISEKMRLNVSYFCSLYSDYEKQAAYGTETYSRTNHVIGLGFDYKF